MAKEGRNSNHNHAHHHETLSFPKGFLWGTATSAHQVEGNNDNNDWWQWEQRDRVTGNQKSGLACDHDNRFEQDFDFAAKMHHNAHRFSIEWSRIEPKPDGWDYAAVEHYRAVLKALRVRGMKTMVTLHHFTNPLWFAQTGSWERIDAAYRFARYAAFIARELGNLVDFWITINEPMIFAANGWLNGKWPPGKLSLTRFLIVKEMLELAHQKAFSEIKKIRKTARIGIAQNIFSYQLYRPHNFWDRNFMNWLDRFWNHSFLSNTAGYHDFIGLNYYFHYRLKKFRFNLRQFFADPHSEQRDASDIGWEIFPPGITEALITLKEYGKPIYITENGVATDNDHRRVRYLLNYLKEIYTAIRSGVDVRGYFYWSLLDNFEWEKGFGPRFGLVDVDFKTQRRKLKPSGKIFGQIAHANAIEHRLLKYLGHGIKVPQ